AKDVANIDSSLKYHYYDTLTTNLTYYWRMRARNITDTSSWTTPWEFRVVPKKPEVDSVVVSKNQFNFTSDTLRILYYPNGDIGDTATMVFDYSLNNGLTWFSTTNILVSSAKFPIKNIPTLMAWLSDKDFSFIENDSVKVRITLVGIGGAGTPRASSVFSLDNNPPTFGGLTTAFAETTGNAITLSWAKGSDKNGPVRYYIFYAEKDSNAINYSTPIDSITNENTLTKTLIGLKNYVRYYLAVRARDRADNYDGNTVVKKATPSKPVRLISITSPSGVFKDSVYIPFEVVAAIDDTITMIGEFSKNDGSTWFSILQLGGRATKVSNVNFKDSVLWRTRSDNEFTESMTTKFRLTAFGLAVNSATLQTNKFTVDNTPPYIDSIKSVVNNGQNIAGSVALSWTKPTDISSPVAYQMYVSETATYNRATPNRAFPLTKPSINVDSMWIPGLKALTKYHFTMWYKDSLLNTDSTLVSKAKYFTTGMLTDYTNDARILTDDLAKFSDAWKNNNKLVGDISPYRGTFPAVSIDNDGIIDLEDLTLFVRIWNWAFVNGKGGTLSNSFAKGSNATESEGNISTGETKLLKDGKTLSIPFYVTGVKSFDAMNLMLSYNTNSVKVDSFVLNNGLKKYFGESIVALFNSDSKYGITSTAFANLGFKELTPETTTELGVLYATIKNNTYEGSFSGGFEIYSVSKNINQNGTLSLNYKTEPVLPKIFALEQNYPNPFNPKTNIIFALPVPSNVKIEIYNILGEKVIELVNQQHNAGLHTVEWNANVSSGLYFYRINAESIDKTRRFVQTKKMLFLK
ncbi:MAG: T9SS type A sorting domain-containing protein, partial [Ignavibacteria bacterium]|nr:T9SS type A sorting domain-containing protein [Ignavibacteria bacterium]